MLRAIRPDLRIGFFLHIPFPPVELFMQLPRRAEILRGLLGADLVGFQRPLAAQNFLRLTRHLLGLRPRGAGVDQDGRIVHAAAFPISIDVAEIEALAPRPLVRARASGLRAGPAAPQTATLGADPRGPSPPHRAPRERQKKDAQEYKPQSQTELVTPH